MLASNVKWTLFVHRFNSSFISLFVISVEIWSLSNILFNIISIVLFSGTFEKSDFATMKLVDNH